MYQGPMQLMTSEGAKKAQNTVESQMGILKQREQSAKNIGGAAGMSQMRDIQNQEHSLRDLMQTIRPASPTPGQLSQLAPKDLQMPLIDTSSLDTISGKDLGTAAGNTALRQIKGQQTDTPDHQHRMDKPASNALQQITVQVEGFCINCGTKMKNENQRQSTTPVPQH
jgi:hypothetical protein